MKYTIKEYLLNNQSLLKWTQLCETQDSGIRYRGSLTFEPLRYLVYRA